jgi:hypothetical protein
MGWCVWGGEEEELKLNLNPASGSQGITLSHREEPHDNGVKGWGGGAGRNGVRRQCVVNMYNKYIHRNV